MTRKKWFLVLLAVVVVLGLGFFLRARGQSKKERLDPVVKGPAIEAIYAIGKVEAVRTFQAKAGVPTGIVSLPAREGALVKRGDVIAVFSEGNVVKAPFDGVVTSVNFKVGESVFAGNLIAEVIDPSEYQMRVVLDQRAAVKVKHGQIAKMSFDGLRNQEFSGLVRSVYSSGAQFTVMVDTKSLPREILPGMTADLSIEVSRKDVALLIPAAALQAGQVERVRDGSRKLVQLKTGVTNGDKVEVLEGDLVEGDQVVVKLK